MEGFLQAAGPQSADETPRFGPPKETLHKMFSCDMESRMSGIVVDGRDEAAMPSPRLGQASPPLADPEDFGAPVRRIGGRRSRLWCCRCL